MSNSTNRTIDSVLAEFSDRQRDVLIPLLQKVQEADGYLSEESIARIGRELDLPASKIFGVATFYNQFRFSPKGKHHVMLCRGTACHVKGSAKLLEQVETLLGIEAGRTTRDKMFSIEVVACMGACGLAPVININGEFHAKVTPKRLEQIIAECRAQEETHAQA